jgi:hypothetical protein
MATAVHAATFHPSGEGAFALSRTGLFRWVSGGWRPLSLPPHVRPSAIRGLRGLDDGRILFFGEGGLVGHLTPTGHTQLWQVPDREITFHAAHVDPSGATTTLVGERPYRGALVRAVPGHTAGVVVQFSGERITVMSDAVATTRLRGITRLSSGLIVACGDWGAIVRIELGVVEYVGAVCAGHLGAIAPLSQGGAVTVGAGGHALSLSPALVAQLEAVQTTREVLCVYSTEDGQTWAGSAQARLLRRSHTSPTTWARMSGEIGVTSNIIAIWANTACVRAIGDDGAVIEGKIA